ncbi:unnamed protein product [Toxocara canis]|uniref:CPG4 domain-containing protein n=1 Tax=Toxocara canis TaxID=6265 RepID=A0A183UZ65_TOXCA|nr:unnamed protein product [Toxocara canis]
MFSETGDFGITLAEQLQLSRAVVANNAMAKELFQKASIIEGFSAGGKCCNIKEHARTLSELIDFCIHEIHSSTKVAHAQSQEASWQSLDVTLSKARCPNDPSKLNCKKIDRCMSIGEMHCGASDRSMNQVWDQFGDCLAEAITKAEPVRGKRECLKAWNALVSFIVDSTKGGYLAEYKRRTAKKWSRQENSATYST